MDEEFLYKIYCDYYDIGKPQNFKLNTDVEYIQLLASYKEIKDKTLKKTIKNFKDLFSKKLRDSILNSKNKDDYFVDKNIVHITYPLEKTINRLYFIYNSIGKKEWNKIFNFDFENYSSDFIERAAQIIFMNKTCFNGLFRVNKKGEFNVPFGKYKNPKIFDADNLMAASFALKNTKIVQGSFLESEKLIDENSLVYLDPPYRPLSKSSSFTSYSKFDFNDDDQIELAEYYKRISKIGAKAILSNSDPKNTDENDNFFDDLYCDFTIDRIQAPRMISCNGNERKPVNEILVRNF